MTAILTGDVHLTDRDQDEYRWGLLDFLCTQSADELIICGDLTDAKDRHSSKLVNRFMNSLAKLTDHFYVYIVMGNHDAINLNSPFFEFINSTPHANFIKFAETDDLSIGRCLFIPSGYHWQTDFALQKEDFIFTHVTFNGAKAENGSLLPGVDSKLLKDYRGMCYSGDIHVPQKISDNIEYIGAPYHIRFGDAFEPRLIKLHKNGEAQNLHYPCPRKYVVNITTPDELEEETYIKSGDMVKVRCFLKRADLSDWKKYKEEIKEICDSKKWVLFGPELIASKSTKNINTTNASPDLPSYRSSEELIKDFATKYKVPENYVDVGKNLLCP